VNQKIREDTVFRLQNKRFLGSSPVWFDSEESHDTGHSFLVDLEMDGESFVTVGRMITESSFDHLLGLPILLGLLVHVVLVST